MRGLKVGQDPFVVRTKECTYSRTIMVHTYVKTVTPGTYTYIHSHIRLLIGRLKVGTDGE